MWKASAWNLSLCVTFITVCNLTSAGKVKLLSPRSPFSVIWITLSLSKFGCQHFVAWSLRRIETHLQSSGEIISSPAYHRQQLRLFISYFSKVYIDDDKHCCIIIYYIIECFDFKLNENFSGELLLMNWLQFSRRIMKIT